MSISSTACRVFMPLCLGALTALFIGACESTSSSGSTNAVIPGMIDEKTHNTDVPDTPGYLPNHIASVPSAPAPIPTVRDQESDNVVQSNAIRLPFVVPSMMAKDPNEICADFKSDFHAALEKYKGERMAIEGTVRNVNNVKPGTTGYWILTRNIAAYYYDEWNSRNDYKDGEKVKQEGRVMNIKQVTDGRCFIVMEAL
ncbi:MAG: hypothetical protein IJ228_10580 [Succinivibrio sp.]|nr:hypothetical protein [Succinivibrio sp.]